MISNPQLVLPTVRQAVVEFQAMIDALTEGHWSKLNADMVKEIQAKKLAHEELERVLSRSQSPLAPVGEIVLPCDDYEIDN